MAGAKQPPYYSMGPFGTPQSTALEGRPLAGPGALRGLFAPHSAHAIRSRI